MKGCNIEKIFAFITGNDVTINFFYHWKKNNSTNQPEGNMVFLKTFFPATKHHSHYFQSIIFTRKCIGNEYVFQQISTLFKTPKTKQLNPFFSFFIKGKLKKKTRQNCYSKTQTEICWEPKDKQNPLKRQERWRQRARLRFAFLQTNETLRHGCNNGSHERLTKLPRHDKSSPQVPDLCSKT